MAKIRGIYWLLKFEQAIIIWPNICECLRTFPNKKWPKSGLLGSIYVIMDFSRFLLNIKEGLYFNV